MKETIVKINKTKSWFFEKVNKIDNLTLHLKQWEKEQKNPQSQQKERNHKDQSRNK